MMLNNRENLVMKTMNHTYTVPPKMHHFREKMEHNIFDKCTYPLKLPLKNYWEITNKKKLIFYACAFCDKKKNKVYDRRSIKTEHKILMSRLNLSRILI